MQVTTVCVGSLKRSNTGVLIIIFALGPRPHSSKKRRSEQPEELCNLP